MKQISINLETLDPQRDERVIMWLGLNYLTQDERDKCNAGSQWHTGFVNRVLKKLLNKPDEHYWDIVK